MTEEAGRAIAPDTTSSARKNGESGYNKIFEFYAEQAGDELDLEGLVAYALYKRLKRDWIVKQRTEHGERPSDAEIKAVINNYLTDDMRATLRDRAADLLSQYGETYVEAATPEIAEDALNTEMVRKASNTHREVSDLVSRSTSLWRSIWVGIVSAFAWTAILAVLLIATKLFGIDPLDGWLALNEVTEPH